MIRYIVTIFDIKDITKPKKVDEIIIENVFSKGEAMDKAHAQSESLYPKISRMIEIRKDSF